EGQALPLSVRLRARLRARRWQGRAPDSATSSGVGLEGVQGQVIEGSRAVCYTVFFSTTADSDFENEGGGLFKVEGVEDDDPEPVLSLLQYPNRWYLASKFGGCSCHYRHACAEFGEQSQWFGDPEEWMEEDMEDAESTAAFYDFAARLVHSGEHMDIIDVFES